VVLCSFTLWSGEALLPNPLLLLYYFEGAPSAWALKDNGRQNVCGNNAQGCSRVIQVCGGDKAHLIFPKGLRVFFSCVLIFQEKRLQHGR